MRGQVKYPCQWPLSLAFAAGVLCTAPLASVVHAQSVEAESLFSDGQNLMKEGKIGQACEAFEASNRIEPRAGTLIRLGECREQNQQLAAAWSAYKDALTRVQDPRKKAFAIARLTALEPRLSRLMISVSDEDRVDGLTLSRNGQSVDPALWNRSIPLNGGSYTIVGTAPGREAWKTTVVVPVESGQVRVEVPRLRESTLQPPAAKRDATSTKEAARPGEIANLWTSRRKVAIGGIGASIVGVFVGAVFSVQAQSKQDAAHEICPDPRMPCANAAHANEWIREGQRRAFGANVAFGVAALAAIGAGVLWFTGAPEQPRHRIGIVPTLSDGQPHILVFASF